MLAFRPLSSHIPIRVQELLLSFKAYLERGRLCVGSDQLIANGHLLQHPVCGDICFLLRPLFCSLDAGFLDKRLFMDIDRHFDTPLSRCGRWRGLPLSGNI